TRMRQTIGPAGTDHTQVIGAVRQVRQPVAHLDPGLAVALEGSFARHQLVAARTLRRHNGPETGGQSLAMEPGQLRLGIKHIDVTWSAFHEQKDHRPGARGRVPSVRSQRRDNAAVVFRCEKSVTREERSEGQSAETTARPLEELTSGRKEGDMRL